jgi:hypothetical protein
MRHSNQCWRLIWRTQLLLLLRVSNLFSPTNHVTYTDYAAAYDTVSRWPTIFKLTVIQAFADFVGLNGFCSCDGIVSRCSKTRTSRDRFSDRKRSVTYVYRQSIIALHWCSSAGNFAVAPRCTPW